MLHVLTKVRNLRAEDRQSETGSVSWPHSVSLTKICIMISKQSALRQQEHCKARTTVVSSGTRCVPRPRINKQQHTN